MKTNSQFKSRLALPLILLIASATISTACKPPTEEQLRSEQFNMIEHDDHSEHIEDDLESVPDLSIQALSCRPASQSQINLLDSGNIKLNKFLRACYSYVRSSTWCNQLTRPNPSSLSVFRCTYGEDQEHRMIHPDESTWKYAFQAAKLVKELQAKSIKVCQIYNWWRAEPYNANVGGAAGRHPYGTSVDVRFCSMADMAKAHKQLCAWRKAGRLRAIGYYGSTGLHLGIGDRLANTWGKSCL